MANGSPSGPTMPCSFTAAPISSPVACIPFGART
jgi:hypothetical protein